MAGKIQRVKGTRDLLPPETALWAAVEEQARRTFALYGYREIRTPIFEETELFARGVGESSDIVGKEMYSFKDRGGRDVTLRPESTASVCRAYLEHGMDAGAHAVRLFYIGPQFRYERPQKGRYRQFHQIGVELLGGEGPQSDVEILLMLVAFFRALGFRDLEVLLNTVGDAASRALYRTRLVDFLTPLADSLSEDSRRRLATNPLRILDTKSPAEQALLVDAPRLEDSLSAASREHFAQVRELLSGYGLDYRVDSRLVRGLDYYTNTVFEIVSAGLGAQNALCGGGAYESLIEELGGKPTYGVGFAIGQDRLLDVLPADSPQRSLSPGPILIRVVDPMSSDWQMLRDSALELAEELRKFGLPAVSLGEVSSLQSYTEADLLKSPAIILYGNNEYSGGTLTVRAAATRQQQTLPRAEAISHLKSFYPLPVLSTSSTPSEAPV